MPTPRHLWIVGILALLWNLFGAFDYLMTQTQNASYMAGFTEAQLEYFYSFPVWATSSWAIAIWGSVLGTILLLMRKKIAVPVFLVSWLAMIVTTIYSITSGGFEVMGGIGHVAFTAVIFLIAGGLWFYARMMAQRQVLA